MDNLELKELRQEHRRKILKGGKIILADLTSVIDVLVRDLSAHGARLIISSTAGVISSAHGWSAWRSL